MSAWVVSRKHVAAIVKAAITMGLIKQPNPEAFMLASVMLAQNERSVAERYGHDQESIRAFTLQEIDAAPDLTPTELVKACQCLEYQSCETEDWKTTGSYAALCQFTGAAVLAGAETSGDGKKWAAAPWGIQ